MRPVARAVPAMFAVAVLALVVLAGCGSGDDASQPATPTPSNDSTSPGSTGTPVPGASTGASSPGVSSPGIPGGTAPGSGTVARAVYWLGATTEPGGPRLYREFVSRPARLEPVRDAVELMLAGKPADPDYTSLWATGTTLRALRVQGSTAVVDLSEQARTNGGGSAFEAATLQQLVHTVTAADPTLSTVRLLIESEPVETLWGSADASRPLSRGEASSTLGPVWLDVPEGGTIGRTFGGTATVFEAVVSWQLRQGDRVVDEGSRLAAIGAPGRGAWTATTTAPAGAYELWAYESSPRDGAVTWLDTKNVTVTG